jgi:acid phosphatase
MRPFLEENIAPNAPNCRRLDQLVKAFSYLAAEKWNASPEMQYLQSRIGKFLPPGGIVAVDGQPRLVGIMDTVNSSLAHAPATRLPGEFYEPRVLEILDNVNTDEWYRGFAQSSEYRRLGVGSLLGDVKDRMISSMASDHQSRMKIALMGCHDTTIAGMLASLGAFDHKWPPFTSSIAIELFREKQANHNRGTGILAGLFAPKKEPEGGWYVRLRYNDKPVVVKGCKPPGKHLPGDESFCTLV